MTEDRVSAPLQATARWLGYAGLLPQAFALFLAVTDEQARWVAPAAVLLYAASLFSLLGGLWGGAAVAGGRPRAAVFVVAVMPSLLALAALLPWLWGWAWPRPYLVGIGVLIAASPLVDRWLVGIVPMPADWLSFRLRLSGGLGILTALLALV